MKSINNKWFYIAGLIFALILGGVLFKFSQVMVPAGNGVEVDWRLLGEMDYITGKASGELTKLNGKAVKVPGFVVPLEDDQKHITEFLLVPTPQACIHVPAPPPNQMVYVKMKHSGTEAPMGPVWVHGTLNLVTKKSMYGDASFEIQGELVEPYK